MTDCDHAEHTDPRYAGTCMKCGQEMTQRNRSWEEQFLTEAATRAKERFGLDIPIAVFVREVVERLEVGQKRYGDRWLNYKAVEIQEEGQDGAAYSALISQQDFDDEEAWRLFEIAQHAAAIDAHARILTRAARLG